ncbi:hypothetical protein F2Q68_00042061 [Brassica cretica]|uniref:Uncharacterized protein n=1 Tax=Brassica cretica TaxID=69181 RepID=A0A8S9MIN1_BRACR|nr:hypothetical protein F2Q68_00042061 [Brassica cretica]
MTRWTYAGRYLADVMCIYKQWLILDKRLISQNSKRKGKKTQILDWVAGGRVLPSVAPPVSLSSPLSPLPLQFCRRRSEFVSPSRFRSGGLTLEFRRGWPSRLGRSSPYDMDLLSVSVGGAGVRCLLSPSVCSNFGLSGWVLEVMSGVAIGVHVLLSSVAGSQLQMRVGLKVFGFVNQVLLTSVVARSMVWCFSTSSFSPNKSFVLTLSAALRFLGDYSTEFMFVALLMVNRCRIEAAI